MRPLRLTIDSSEDGNGQLAAGTEDAFSWLLLCELTSEPELDIAFTVPGGHSWLDMPLDTPAVNYTVTSRDATGKATRWTGVDEWEFWSHNSTFQRGEHLYRKLALAAAHASAHRDLFVTVDPVLLAERHRLARANIVHPAEALPIIHLHLRMQPQFAYRWVGRSRFTMDRGMFFLVALRERMPRLWQLIWRTQSIPALDERLLRLGNAVRTKCIRCLEARDELAFLFYAGDTDLDRRGYHFTYVLLLLSGALDALAKVAWLIHDPAGAKGASAQKRVSFNLRDVRKKMQGWGVQPLVDIVTSDEFLRFCELVWRPRNRIHAEEYNGVLHHAGLQSQALIRVDAEDGAALTAAAHALGGASRFGLTGGATEPSIEPYTYTLEVLQRGFAFIEAIAGAIDCGRHPGYDAADDRPEQPVGDNDLFAPDTLRRVRCFIALDLARDIHSPRFPARSVPDSRAT